MRFSIILILAINLNILAQKTAVEYSRYSDKVPVNSVSKNLPDSIFNYVKDNLGILDFNDCNNCNARSHIIAKVIQKHFPEVSVCKAWIFTDHKRASRTKTYSTKSHDFLNDPCECGKWAYHVAPMIINKRPGAIDSMVIDPSVWDSPLSLAKWSALLLPDKENCYIVVKDVKYFSFPDDVNGKFDDTKEIWIDDQNESLLDEDCARSIENILQSRILIWDPWTFRHYISQIQSLLN